MIALVNHAVFINIFNGRHVAMNELIGVVKAVYGGALYGWKLNSYGSCEKRDILILYEYDELPLRVRELIEVS